MNHLMYTHSFLLFHFRNGDNAILSKAPNKCFYNLLTHPGAHYPEHTRDFRQQLGNTFQMVKIGHVNNQIDAPMVVPNPRVDVADISFSVRDLRCDLSQQPPPVFDLNLEIYRLYIAFGSSPGHWDLPLRVHQELINVGTVRGVDRNTLPAGNITDN